MIDQKHGITLRQLAEILKYKPKKELIKLVLLLSELSNGLITEKERASSTAPAPTPSDSE